MLARVRTNLPTTQRNMTQLQKTRFLTQLQALNEKTRQRLEMTISELANGVMVRVLIGRDHPKGNILIGRLFNPARTGNSYALGI